MAPDSEEGSRRRQPKGDKRDRTRTKLLEAARSLIREKGHENTTLEEIAERAGMTTGAIYGNFKNRDELFISLGQTYWPPIKPQVKPGSSFAAIMRAMAEATIAAIPDRSAAAVGRLTGLAYTLTHEEMRAQVERSRPEATLSANNGFTRLLKRKIFPCQLTSWYVSYMP